MTAISNKDGRMGIVGGGQLGRMLALAASTLGLETLFIDPSKDAVAQYVARHLCAAFDDKSALEELFANCKAVTFEFENVSLEGLKGLGTLPNLFPTLEALYVANDRIREKEFFQKCGLEVAPFFALVDTDKISEDQFFENISKAGEELGYPLILKTCALGYDGKGQVSISSSQLDTATTTKLLELKTSCRLVIEKKVSFSREVSAIAVRDRAGNVVVYPTPQNVHKDGILFTSTVSDPTPIPELKIAIEKILNRLNYVGVLAIEFFEVGGKYLVNEMAPRVHNTGHWTIEGTVTSQFENHVRAVMGLPLGLTDLRYPTAMINIVGTVPDPIKLLSLSGAHLHLYGKEARLGRKLGHLTIEADTTKELESRVLEALKVIQS